MKIKRTKAKLLTVLALVLGLSMCCAVFAASAAEDVEPTVPPVYKTGDEFSTPTPAFYESNFDDANGAVHEATPFWGNATLSFETENPINGTKSVKAHVENGNNFATLLVATNKIIAEAGDKYAFSIKVKVEGLTKVVAVCSFGEYAEITFQNNNWTATNGFLNFVATPGDGYTLLTFEKDMTTVDNVSGNFFSFFTWGTGDLIIDDFKIVDKEVKANTYYTVQYGSDFENENAEANPWSETPFWSNATLEWETEAALNGDKCLKVDASLDNSVLFAIDTNKVQPKIGELWYFEFKVDIVGFEKVNMVTNYGDYGEASFQNGVWTNSGSGFVDFKAVDGGNYFTVSFRHNVTAIGFGGTNNLVTFYSYGTNSGTFLFDDFFCYKEDNAPSTASAEKDYLMNHPADVDFTLNLKENEITSVKVNNEALDAANYAVEENVLTVKKEYLATLAAGTELEVTVATAGGELALTVNVVDDKTEITAITGITAVNKVYDGNTTATVDVTGAQFTGLETGDALTLTYDSAAFETAVVGTGKTVTLAGLALGGANASKYVLADGLTVTATADITAKEVGVNDVTANDKVYDKTTAATVNTDNASITGVVVGDEVTFSATGSFDSANASADVTVRISFTLEGADAENYRLASSTLITAADITKKAITVTADEKTVTAGETAELTYNVVGLIEGDTLSGELAREEGEEAGVYKITQGTLNNDNYEITFVGADYTINAKAKKGCKSDMEAVYGAAAVLPIMLAVFIIKRKKENA